MGRQWLHAKRAIVNLKKGQTVGKLVKEIAVAAKLGGGDPAGNARLHAVLEKARKANVTRDAIERAIAKGTGTGGDKIVMDHIVYEGYAPHKVALIVEVYTDNPDKVMATMKAKPWDDPVFGKSYIRADGRNMHDMYLFEVKKPSESKGPWDYYNLIATIPAEEAFRPLDQGNCPMVAKKN